MGKGYNFGKIKVGQRGYYIINDAKRQKDRHHVADMRYFWTKNQAFVKVKSCNTFAIDQCLKWSVRKSFYKIGSNISLIFPKVGK